MTLVQALHLLSGVLIVWAHRLPNLVSDDVELFGIWAATLTLLGTCNHIAGSLAMEGAEARRLYPSGQRVTVKYASHTNRKDEGSPHAVGRIFDASKRSERGRDSPVLRSALVTLIVLGSVIQTAGS